jgi:hypothetical protein
VTWPKHLGENHDYDAQALARTRSSGDPFLLVLAALLPGAGTRRSRVAGRDHEAPPLPCPERELPALEGSAVALFSGAAGIHNLSVQHLAGGGIPSASPILSLS